jgi:transcriptional regulator of acetoin/glycerol metabolism
VLSENDLPDGMARKSAPARSSIMSRTVARPVSQVPAKRASADNVYVLDAIRRDTACDPAASDLSGPAAGLRSDDSARERVLDALDQHGWNMSASARALGICRASLYRVLRRMDIPLIREQASASTRSRNF